MSHSGIDDDRARPAAPRERVRGDSVLDAAVEASRGAVGKILREIAHRSNGHGHSISLELHFEGEGNSQPV